MNSWPERRRRRRRRTETKSLNRARHSGRKGRGPTGFPNATSSTGPNDVNLLFGLFDNVTVTAVPEPSTLTLALGSGIGLLLLRRRSN